MREWNEVNCEGCNVAPMFWLAWVIEGWKAKVGAKCNEGKGERNGMKELRLRGLLRFVLIDDWSETEGGVMQWSPEV